MRLIRAGWRIRLALVLALGSLFLPAPTAHGLVIASPDFEPADEIPTGFPYWEHVTQRRYEGPSVIYLGAGWAMTARHVGYGEIILQDQIFAPERNSWHILLNVDGTAADAIVFRLRKDGPLPDLPILPLASEPPRPGEEVLLIGFGRGRARVFEWPDEGRDRYAFEWTENGSKRWGSNRIASPRENLIQAALATRSFTFVFDQPHSENATPHEAQAAVGDSGGGVFVERDGKWLLAGMMTSVMSESNTPKETSTYGDITFATDLSYYRSEILRWARPKCANEQDDDGDRKIDFPLDPDCRAPSDDDERAARPMTTAMSRSWAIGLAGLFVFVAFAFLVFQSRRPH